MRLVGIRPLPFLQIFYIRTEIPLELRAPKRGYDGISVLFIGEIAGGRVVRPRHEHPFVTAPFVTDPAPPLMARSIPCVFDCPKPGRTAPAAADP